jgi:hypothetical protein
MRKSRRHFVWALALALALGLTGVANAASTQSLSASISPTKLDKKKYKKSVKLSIHTTTSGASGFGPTDAVKALPAETQTADIDFDKNIKFTTKGLPQCDPSLVSGDTDAAKAACPDSIVGSGTAVGNCVPNPSISSVTPTVVTAFNGVPNGGKPTIILQSVVHQQNPDGSTGAYLTTIPLIGTLEKSPVSGYGTRLHVPVDQLLGGACTLVDFQTTVGKTYKAKSGKKKKKRFYISARCKSKKIKVTSDWSYYNGAPAINGVDNSTPIKCKPKKKHHHH